MPYTLINGQKTQIDINTGQPVGQISTPSTDNGQIDLKSLLPILQKAQLSKKTGIPIDTLFPEAKDKKESVALRKEFSSETKNLGFETMRDSWQKVQKAGETGSGDLTVVYSYIKALDPNSVVREGEINLTKAAESIPSNIIRAYKRAKEGKVLSPEVRNEMVSEIGNLYNEKAKQQQELNAFYTGLANDSGIDPNDVIGKIGEIEFADIPNAPVKKKGGVTAGGILGGILGGAGGLIVGGPVGAGVGGAIGAGAGGATENMIKDLLGKQTQTSGEQLGQVSKQAAVTGLSASALAKFLPGLLGAGGRAIGMNTGNVAKVGATGASVKEGIVKVGEKLESLNPAKFMRSEQIKSAEKLSNIKIDPSPIEQSVKSLINKIPSLQKTYDEYGGVVKSIKDPKTLLDALDIFKDAYTQSGKVKSGLEPKMLKTLYQSALDTLKTKAPEVATNRTLTKYAIDMPKVAGKALWRATLGKVLLGGS